MTMRIMRGVMLGLMSRLTFGLLMLLAAGMVYAQPARQQFTYTATDPAGACANGQANQYNYILNKEWGCNNSVWTVVANGGGGGGGSPAPPVNSLQFDSAGMFGAVTSSTVRPTGSIEIAPGFATPVLSIGIVQNLLKASDCYDCTGWTLTNATVGDLAVKLPDGTFLGNGGPDDDITSTVANGFATQCYDTSVAMTGRTFGFSMYLKGPTPVTSRMTIHSDTPTIAVDQTVSVTSTWARYFVSGTFGVDAGTQVCVDITPVDGGTGRIFGFIAQLEEPTTALPDMPAMPTSTADTNTRQITRQRGIWTGTLGNAFDSISSIVNLGYNNSISSISGGQIQGILGQNNAITASGQAIILGSHFKHTQGNAVSIGINTTDVENDVNNGMCLTMAGPSGGKASTGNCGILVFQSGQGTRYSGSIFSSLGTPGDGVMLPCSDCTVTSAVDNTCASDGSMATPPTVHAFAYRINGAWKCVQ